MRRIGRAGEPRKSRSDATRWQPAPADSPIATLSLAALRDLGMSEDAIAAYFNDEPFQRSEAPPSRDTKEDANAIHTE
jgi:hypothetical protein